MSLKSWFRNNILEKLNPAQSSIAYSEGSNIQAESSYNYLKAYDTIPVVRRGVDLIVNGSTSLDVDVLDKINGLTPVVPGLRKTKVASLLNFQPNPYLDINKFRRLIYLDLILEGNSFIYWDGAWLYVLPASKVEILTDPITYVKGYRYNSVTDFKPDEIMHISDNSSKSIYGGTSRLKSVTDSLAVRNSMISFQAGFFKNSAVPGLVLMSPNVLGDKIKARMVASWQQEYNPTKNSRRPLILDGGLTLDKLSDTSFQELDFKNSVTSKDEEILVALGVPPILVNGGNNANITPNIRLMYLETILPLVRSVNSAFERFFGYDIDFITTKASSLNNDLRDEAAYYSTLVNGGVISANEARSALRYEPKPDSDDLRVPANIAGSAAGDPSGGKPPDNGGN